MTESKNEKMKLEASKYILETIRIAPSKDYGLWWVGPTTVEEIESQEHVKAMHKKLEEINTIMNSLQE